MKTLILITAIFSIGLTSAFAADKQPGNKKEAANLKANPNDLIAFNNYMRATVTQIRALIENQPRQVREAHRSNGGVPKNP